MRLFRSIILAPDPGSSCGKKLIPAVGSLAAGFQAYAYGAFTPAGGFFAFFTSMGMLGLMMPLGLAAGVVLATLVTIICFLAGVGL